MNIRLVIFDFDGTLGDTRRNIVMTLQSLSARPEETLVVGDMPVDVLMGKGAGTHTCAVTYGNASRAQLEEAESDFIINDMAELTSLFAR